MMFIYVVYARKAIPPVGHRFTHLQHFVMPLQLQKALLSWKTLRITRLQLIMSQVLYRIVGTELEQVLLLPMHHTFMPEVILLMAIPTMHWYLHQEVLVMEIITMQFYQTLLTI